MLTPPSPLKSQISNLKSDHWSQQGVGSRRQHRFFYWLIRLLGKRPAYHFAYAASFWYVLFYPSIRRRCRFYLDRRFPERRGPLRRFRDTFRLVRNFAVTLVDRMAMGILGPQSLGALSPDYDRVMQLAAGPRGLVLVHAHVGGAQMSMSGLGKFPKHVWLTMIPDPRIAALFDPQAVTVIDPRQGLESIVAMTDALLHGDVVAMAGDRTVGHDKATVPARFLGGSVQFPIAPYRLASATGAAVAVLVAPKIGPRTYELRLAKVIDVPASLGRNARDYAPYAQQFADCLEQFVGEYPWQFYNFYDLWSAAD
jgi:predicted LPLAT superfamily acyltransferase